MNRQAKSAIKSLVLTLRHKLEEDIAIGLKRYGFGGERWLPIERLPHIERDDAATADHFRLRAALEQHLRRIGAEPSSATAAQRGEAVEWFVREVAFTHLNRLVALKCLEARGLIPEIITVRDAYGGRARAHYEYRFDHPAEAAAADDALPAAIRHVCRIVYPEFRLLFDVGDPATGRKPPADDIVWPSYPVLRECIALINGLDDAANLQPPTSSLWLEDEIIGWIYQFYNAEQKEAIRARGAPRRPAEVAVINQFFTPRWIVKFLVDNTLGRLWLEMHPDSPRVRAKCDYLVPEPAAGVRGQESGSREQGFALDPDSPINYPKAPPRRKAKRPQDIRLIDLACGVMHFGHYAFEVFQEIYADAREQGWVTGADALPDEEVPAAILRYNLYGVDIDLRAVQLAALSLFIKAKTANPQAHLTQMNLVVADAVLPADGVRAQFLDRYKDDKVVQDAVRQVLDEMANVAEVGSLLRVEERLHAILEKAGHSAATTKDERRNTQYAVRTTQLALADLPEAQPADWEAHYTVTRLLDDLREFAARALQTHDLNAQLFAEEAEKSVHLLDVFLNDYDVAVMNPPYGQTINAAKAYLERSYPNSKNDLYAAFIERGLDLTRTGGYVGALVSRTFLYLSSFEKFRRQVLLARSEIPSIAELGLGVLDDATVRPAAVLLRSKTNPNKGHGSSTFYRLPQIDLGAKSGVLEAAIKTPEWGIRASVTFVMPPTRFAVLPRSPFTYWASESLLSSFARLPSLDRDNVEERDNQVKVADVKEGLGTRHDERFLRFSWEVSSCSADKWIPFAKGGECLRYYKNIELAVDWAHDGQAVRRNITEKYPYLDGKTGWLVKNTDHYFREGMTYTRESEKTTLGAYHLPRGCIFSDKGPAVFFAETDHLWWAMGLLNSTLLAGFVRMLTPDRSRPIGLVSSLPFAIPAESEKKKLANAVCGIYDAKKRWDTGTETCTRFTAPWVLQARRGVLLLTANDGPSTAALDLPALPVSQSTSLPALLDYLLAVEHAADARLQQLQAEIDDAVYELYEITPEDRALIERELGDRPPELVWPQMAGKPDTEKRREHVRRLVSYFLLLALKEKRDGILPVTPVAGELSSLDAVRRGLEAEFGEAAAFRMENDIGQVLGQSLADWLDGPFIKWHTPLYKRRPVVWHLASPKNAFGCFIYLHKLDADTLRKVQTLYLWPRRRGVEAERDEALRARAAGITGASRRLEAAEALLDDLAEFEKRLLSVIQAQVRCEIPEWAEGPFRNGVYDPVLDDGVKVNITPLQEAGVLRYGKVV